MVTVVSQAFVNKFFPNEDPIGKRFGMENPSDYEIVGIVEDAKYIGCPRLSVAHILPAAAADEKSHWAESGLARSNNIHDIELRVAGETKDLAPALAADDRRN